MVVNLRMRSRRRKELVTIMAPRAILQKMPEEEIRLEKQF